jgi:hypothetical protein
MKPLEKKYASIILAQNKPFKENMDRALSTLRNNDMDLYPKATDHENTVEVGWLL